MTSLKFFNYVPKLFLTLVLSFLTGFCLSAEPADVTDRELSIVTAYSELELELDARITYEMTPGVGANLATIFQIEQELMASSMHERKLDLLSRILELKYSVLATEADDTVVNTQKTERVKAQAGSAEKKGLVASGGTESDPPELTAISVDKVSVDVSQTSQIVTFTVEATDATGINWGPQLNTRVVLRNQNGKYFSAYGDDNNPGVLTMTLEPTDPSGTLTVQWLKIIDTLGNDEAYYYSESLAPLGLPASIEIIGGVESDPPALVAISVDKVSVDVSQTSQTVTFIVEATDATGINWGPQLNTRVVLRNQNGKYFSAYGDDNNPGVLTMTLEPTDPSGTLTVQWLKIIDTLGNDEAYYYSESLAPLGLPAFIYILENGEATSNITVSGDSEITNVSENSEVNYSLKIENLASVPTGQLTFELKSTNIRVNAVSQAGSSACSISSVNYNSTVSCALSGVDANASKLLNLTLAPGVSGAGSFNANIVASIPDVSYLNNYVTVSLAIDPDGDGDGIANNVDNCLDDANSDQLDTDADGNGNACDLDDDGDGVEDSSDAFPIDETETIDTDSDGTGNNADTDDDGDGVADSLDAFPLISLNGRTDTDSDGRPNDCDSACIDLGMTADDDDDGDGVDDVSDAFPLDASESTDTDADGVGDNSDPFPENPLYTLDSDSDGMPDAWETRYGLDPNDASDATSDVDNDGVSALDEFLAGTIPSGSLDLDGNSQYDALTDGLLLLRGMFGLDGSALVTGTVASDATYIASADIESRIATLGDLADIDGNGTIDALTDGLLTLRYLFGLEGDTLIAGVVAADATRTTAVDIEAHLKTLMPAL